MSEIKIVEGGAPIKKLKNSSGAKLAKKGMKNKKEDEGAAKENSNELKIKKRDLEKNYNEWYEKTYFNVIGLNRVIEYAKKNQRSSYLNNIINTFRPIYSSIWRQESMADLKYIIHPKKSEYITVSFKVSRLLGKKIYSTIFAFLYIYPEIQGGDIRLIFEYICHSSTFRSADGEYRRRLIPYQQFVNVIDENSKIFAELDNHFIGEIGDEKINLSYNVNFKYRPEKSESKKFKKYLLPSLEKSILIKLENQLQQNRIILKSFYCAWLLDSRKNLRNDFENHVFQDYQMAMYGKEDRDFLQKFASNELEPKRTQELILIKKGLTFIYSTPNRRATVTMCGQKIIPLTIKMTEAPRDIRLATWREIFITSHVGDLVINGISPSFPIIADWFFISGSNSNLFDNSIYHIKEQHSNIALQILRELEQSRSKTYVKSGQLPLYLSYKMEILSEKIEIPMDFAEHDIIQSGYSICLLSEHLGRTIADLPKNMMNSTRSKIYGPIFKNMNWFSKYIFELIYSLWCLNSFMKIIHGDLHLNNITIFDKIPTINRSGVTKCPGSHVLYNVQDEMFIFPHNGTFIAIIDFSRGFIWDLDALEKENINTNALSKDYENRIFSFFNQEIPEYTKKHNIDIWSLIRKNFDTVYKIAEGLDFYKFSTDFLALIEGEILQNPKYVEAYCDINVIRGKILPFLKKIRSYTMERIYENFNKLIENPDLSEADFPHLNLELLQKFFLTNKTEFYEPEETTFEDIKIVDYFSDQNQLRYNIREYDKFPPGIKIDNLLKMGIPVDTAREIYQKKYIKYVSKKAPEKQIDNIAKEITDDREKRRGPSEIKKNENDNPAIISSSSSDMIIPG